MNGINSLLNCVHEWGKSDQHPVKRFFLTRIGSVLSIFLEAVSIGYTVGQLGNSLVCRGLLVSASGISMLHPKFAMSKNDFYKKSPFLKNQLKDLSRRIAGLFSTLLVGVFAPETNFRFHKRLEFARDNLLGKKELVLKTKFENELKWALIKEERRARYRKLQSECEAAQEEEDRVNHIDNRLAELLCKNQTT